MTAIERRVPGPINPPEITRPHAPVLGDWAFVVTPIAGAVLGLLLRAGWLWLVVGAVVLTVVAAAGRVLVLVVADRWSTRQPRSVRGLVRMWCSTCGRDLDWVTAAFARRHPAPLCALCRALVDQGSQERAAVIGAPPEGAQA